eukprot:g2115.t1
MKRSKREAEETLNKAQEILQHPDLPFVLAEFLDPLSRFYTRIALRHKKGWIPKQVLEYIEEKREEEESLKWGYSSVRRVVREDKFELVKWVGTFNELVKNSLCERAAEFGKIQTLKWARKQEPPLPWHESVCFRALEWGHYDTLKWLVVNGCPWNDQKKTDFLRYVHVLEDEEEWMKVVVNQVIFSYNNMTTLMMASHFGHTELVCHLLACKGVNVNMENSRRKTSLLLACKSGKLEVVKLLLEHNDTNINHANTYGSTALHEASTWGHIEVVKAILSHPKFTYVNYVNRRERTAFHCASIYGHLEVTKAILSHPKFTSVNQADRKGKTALDWASERGHLEVANAILSQPKSTNVNQADENGRTALDLARSNKKIGVVKAILLHPKFTNVNQVDKL